MKTTTTSRSTQRFLQGMGIIAVACLLAMPTDATPLYVQGPNEGFSDSFQGDFFSSYYADAFCIGEAGELDRVITSIEWWGQEVNPPANGFDYIIRFFDGDDQDGPADLIAGFSDTVTPNGGEHFIWTLPGDGLRVDAGTNYFLSIAADVDLGRFESFAWTHSGPNGSGSSWLTFDGADWTDDGTPQNLAFQLDGYVVPEPTTMTLLGIGVAGLCARRLRNRKRS